MKKIIRSVLMNRNKPDPRNEICDHQKSGISQDQINKSLIFLSKDHCKSCNEHMCNICSDKHIVQHCTMSLGVNRKISQGMQKDFNYGYLMKVNLKNVKCICGKEMQFHNLNHAMCAACGLLSCSDQCHHQWQKQGNCTYHQNFYEPSPQYNLRSIRLSNILNIQSSRIKRWNIAQKTSLSFISCYASRQTDHVYLQRGYRNYGKPQAELISVLQKVPFGLDYTTHIQRRCDCECDGCQNRQVHSVGNCQYECKNSLAQQVDSYQFRQQFHQQCKCTCQFCASGVVVDSHRKIDCLPYCYKSQLNNVNQMA